MAASEHKLEVAAVDTETNVEATDNVSEKRACMHCGFAQLARICTTNLVKLRVCTRI